MAHALGLSDETKEALVALREYLDGLTSVDRVQWGTVLPALSVLTEAVEELGRQLEELVAPHTHSL